MERRAADLPGAGLLGRPRLRRRRRVLVAEVRLIEVQQAQILDHLASSSLTKPNVALLLNVALLFRCGMDFLVLTDVGCYAVDDTR